MKRESNKYILICHWIFYWFTIIHSIFKKKQFEPRGLVVSEPNGPSPGRAKCYFDFSLTAQSEFMHGW